MPQYYTPGLLLIDGVPLTGVTLDLDPVHEALAPEDLPAPGRFEFTAECSCTRADFDAFLRSAGIDNLGAYADPMVDLTIWCAIDPKGPMPILQVGRHTEVITNCVRGGGSIGRVWRGCYLTATDPSDA